MDYFTCGKVQVDLTDTMSLPTPTEAAASFTSTNSNTSKLGKYEDSMKFPNCSTIQSNPTSKAVVPVSGSSTPIYSEVVR